MNILYKYKYEKNLLFNINILKSKPDEHTGYKIQRNNNFREMTPIFLVKKQPRTGQCTGGSGNHLPLSRAFVGLLVGVYDRIRAYWSLLNGFHK
jgi:hypothetical protein